MKNKNYIQKCNQYNLGKFLINNKDAANKMCYNVIKVGETDEASRSQYTNNNILKQEDGWGGAELNNVFVAHNPKSGARAVECRLIDITAPNRWRIKNLQGGICQEFSHLVSLNMQTELGCALAHFTFNNVDVVDMWRFKPTQKGKKTIQADISRFDGIVIDQGFNVLPFGRIDQGQWNDGEFNNDPNQKWYRGENYSDVAQVAASQYYSDNPYSFNFMKLEIKKAMVAVG
jgi:hypothetical protein